MPRRDEELESEPEEPTYDVECINEARVNKKRRWEYNIKWGGYPESDNTWEPESNLTGCKRMMLQFWEQVGTVNKPQVKYFPVGHTLAPTKEWIDRKRRSYQKNKSQKRGTDDTDEDEPFIPANAQSTSQQTSANLDDSDEDDIPLSQKVLAPSRLKISKGNNAGKNALPLKRPRDDNSQPSSEPPIKRSKSLAELSTSKAEALSLKGKEKATDCPSSPYDPLFDHESDSDDTPLISKASTPTLNAPSGSRPSLSLDTSKIGGKSLPAHLERKLNPRVKRMELPSAASGGSGGISTKTRISKGISPSSAVPAGSPLLHRAPDSLQLSSSAQEFDATNWLNENIMPREELARKAAEQGGHSFAELLSSNPNSAAQQGLRFSKKWRWTGQLAVGDNESEDGLAEPIGGIVLTDNTDLDPKASQIGINVLLKSNGDDICFRHQYPLATLRTALADFKVSQFARMTADPSSGDNSFDDLLVYMTKHELFSHAPLCIAEREVAKLFVFPAAQQQLWDPLGVPVKIRQAQGLLVAVGFPAYVPPRRDLGEPTEIYHSQWKTHPKADTVSEPRTLDLSRALLALKFPENVLKRLAHKECAIFTAPTDRDFAQPDSRALATILRSAPDCKLVQVLTGSARFIFIHVSAWDTLHKLPGLVDRRLRRPDIQFYTFGSDPAVERKRWGVREVFPIGGVVTFTPRAIAEDPDGVERLIAKVDEHPLWSCYIIPSVVAMLVEVTSSDSGPNSKLKRAIDALCSILIPIEKGQIALTWQPPPRVAWYLERGDDKDMQPKWIDWMIDQAHLSELRGHELVQECQKRFYRSQDRLEKEVETRMVKDLLAMQSELREEYRRFVIITDTSGTCNTSRELAANTSVSRADIKDGFEFTHVKDFTFNDDYYVDERP